MPALRSPSTTPNRTAVANGPSSWQVLATWLGIVVYIVLFYWVDPRQQPQGIPPRQILFGQLLVPEELINSWVEGDWSRFGIADHIPVIAGALLIWLIAGLTGWLALHWLRATELLDGAEQIVIALATGLNLWSLLTLAIGLAGQLQHRVFFAIPALLFSGLAVWRLWAIRVANASRPPEATGAARESVEYQPLSGFGKLALALCVPLVIVMLLGGTLPPSHFDVREYHLQVPKEWFQQGRITFLPHNVYGNMPLGAEMHALLGMVLCTGKDNWWWGALIGKTVIAAFAPLGAAGVYLIGRRFISSDAGAWGAFAYLSTPWIAHVSMTGLIDAAVGCYVVTAVAMALRAFLPGTVARRTESSDPHVERRTTLPLLAVAGFLAGGAVACKYPALLFLAVPLGALIAVLPNWKIHWKGAGIYSLAVVAGCGLWLAKNWVQSGNPTYPLLYSAFDGRSWNAEKNARWTKAHGTPRDAEGKSFSVSQMWDSAKLLALFSDHQGTWLVPLALAAFWTWPKQRSRWLLAILYGIVAFAIVCWWILTHRVDRFLVPMLPLVAVGAGIGATWTDDSGWRNLAGLLGGVCCLLSFIQIASPYGADNRMLIALSDLRTDLPRGKTPFTRINDAHRWLNEHVEPGHRVLLVGEAQVFDFEVPILYNTCFDDCVLETLLRGRSRDERRQILRDEKISHIFVSWYELDRYRQPGNYGYSDYPTRQLFYDELIREQGLLRPVDVGKSRQILEVFEVIH